MSLQIVTVKEIEEINKRYDTSDHRVLSRDLLGEYSPQTSEIPPRVSELSLFLCGWENE